MRNLCQLFVLGLVLLLPSQATAVAAPEMTADEIFAKSQAAMGAPIQYRLSMGGVDSIVSMKDLGGEIGVASRVETVSPNLEQTTITTAKYAYEWRPNTGLAIDKTLLGEVMLAQAAAIRQSVPSGATMKLLEPETIDGAEHYVIETTVPQGFADAIAKALSITTPFSGATKSWINAETFHLRRMVTASGEMEYLDIKQGIDLPNDLFLPPEGMTFQKPKTVDEYIEIITSASRAKPKPLVKVEPLEDTAPPFWDPEAKTWKASAPPGRDQKEWEAAIANMPSEPSELEKQARQTAESAKSSRSWLLYANLAILAALVAYAFLRRRRAGGTRDDAS
jgi:hypothetical protein